MNAYVWNRVEDVTANWHSEAGVLVVAADLVRATGLIPRMDYGGKVTVEQPGQPDLVLPLAGDHDERVVIFPDSGCC